MLQPCEKFQVSQIDMTQLPEVNEVVGIYSLKSLFQEHLMPPTNFSLLSLLIILPSDSYHLIYKLYSVLYLFELFHWYLFVSLASKLYKDPIFFDFHLTFPTYQGIRPNTNYFTYLDILLESTSNCTHYAYFNMLCLNCPYLWLH